MTDYVEQSTGRAHMRNLVLILLLMGSFAIAFILSTFLHELGHAVALWVQGGEVSRITLHPFSWSVTYYADTRGANPAVLTWSGAVLGSIFSLLIGGLAFQIKHSLMLPFVLTAAAGLAKNGGYFLVDSLILTGGDASSLIARGTHPAVTVAFSVVLLLGGILLFFLLIPLLGLNTEDGIRARLAIMLGGVSPYACLLVLHNLFYEPDQIVQYSVYAALIVGLAVVMAVVSYHLRWLPLFNRIETSTCTPAQALTILAVGALLVAGLYLYGDQIFIFAAQKTLIVV
jgi:hypothetical protein